jgi:hypothetical protein
VLCQSTARETNTFRSARLTHFTASHPRQTEQEGSDIEASGKTNVHDNHTQAILPYVTNPDSSAIHVSTQCPGPYTLPPRSLATLALMRYTRPSRRHVKRSSLGNANLVVSLDRRGNPLQWGKRLAFRDPLTRLPVQSPRSPTHRHTASARGVSFPAAGRAHQAASLGTCQVRTKLTDRKYGLTATGRSPRRRSR